MNEMEDNRRYKIYLNDVDDKLRMRIDLQRDKRYLSMSDMDLLQCQKEGIKPTKPKRSENDLSRRHF